MKRKPVGFLQPDRITRQATLIAHHRDQYRSCHLPELAVGEPEANNATKSQTQRAAADRRRGKG